MKLLKACIALAAFAALLLVPSAASAGPELTAPTGTSIPAGANIQATSVAHAGTASALRLTTSAGNLECATATLTGTLTSNTETHVAGEITTASFSGTPAAPASAHCSSPFGNITVTPSHTTNPAHNGVSSLPWCVTANTLNDQLVVRGGKCSEAARALTFTVHSPIGICSYQRASATAVYTTHPAAAVATVSNQEFTKTTGSVFCPSSGQLDMAFKLETDVAGKSPEDIYISAAPAVLPGVTSPTGTKAPVGTLIQGTNVEHAGTSKIIKFTTPTTTVECATATMTGAITSNAETHVAGEITTVEFSGEPGKEPHGVHCTSGLGNVTATPNHTTNPAHNGVSSTPWCLTANNLKDKLTVRGGKCSEAERPLTFTIHTALAGTCSYQRASLTATYTTHPNPAVATVDSGQTFTKTTGGASCPSEGSFDMAFKLETDAESPKDIYID